MLIAVFGLGHVGLVTAAVLAEHGHTVYGVDTDPQVLKRVKQGAAPFCEPGLNELLTRMRAAGRLLVTAEAERAVRQCNVSLVCVGTPQAMSGEVELSAVERVLDEIGTALQREERYHLVVLRSTVPPTAWRGLADCIERAAGGRQVGPEIGFCANPEFLREGQALRDFDAPPFVVIGHDDARAGYLAAAVYEHLRVPLLTTTPEAAMLLKYTCNTWHALKVAFANEIHAIATHYGLDGHEIMSMFTQDEHLNLSAAYLRPGGPYGGPCLPKDVAGLLDMAAPVGTPLLNALPFSNAVQISELVSRALATGAQRFGVVGLSFKMGTSDIRESPATRVIDGLRAAGREVRVFDTDVPRTVGGDYQEILYADMQAVETWAEVLVVCKPELAALRKKSSGAILTWD